MELERDVEKELLKRVQRLGGICYKWVSPGHNGVPDRIVIFKELPAIFVELKTERGQMTTVQKVEHRKLRRLRQQATVVYGMKGLEKFLCHLRMWLAGYKTDGEPFWDLDDGYR